MCFDVKKLPKKINEYNFFEKNSNGGCTLYSYGLKGDMIIVCELADFEIKKDFCVDSKAIEMLRLLSPIKEVQIDKTFVIKSTKGNYIGKLIGDVPFNKPRMNFENSFKADFSRLKIASGFCATTDKKPILTGVNVNSNGDINATDSFVAYRYVGNGNNENPKSITIPSAFVDFIGKNVDKNEDVIINFNTNTCMIQIDNIKYINRLLDGAFPNLSKVFDSKINSHDLKFNINDLKDKINISKNIGANKDNPIYAIFTNNKFGAIGENDFVANLENKSNYNENYKFTISLDYLSKVLSNLVDNENIVVGYTEPVRPIFIEENGNEFLILPVKKD